MAIFAFEKKNGFTLIEAIVSVAIVGILAGIAWPLYESQTRKNRRTEAISNLTQIQAVLERCYADNGGYDCCQPVVDTYLANPLTPAVNYNITFTSNTTNAAMFACKQDQGYTLTATTIVGMAQEDDLQCSSFTIDNLSARSAIDNSPGVPAPPRPRPACWTD